LISLGILSSSNTGETGKPELKPFLTILGTRMRAKAVYKAVIKEERRCGETLCHVYSTYLAEKWQMRDYEEE